MESGRDRPDVAIIGGGILGLATACELLSQGYAVSVIERNAAESATRAAAGMLSPFAEFTRPVPWLELLVQACHAYAEFVRNAEETSGCRVECRFPGTLVVSLDPADDLSERTFVYRELGARAVLLDADELAATEPALAADAAVLLEDEGYVDPRSLHDALRAACEELGGRWIGGEAQSLIAEHGRVRGVETSGGAIRAEAVVNTAGAGAERFLSRSDRDRIRPRPVQGELLRLRPPHRSTRVRHVVQAPGSAYLVPQDDGTMIVGSTAREGDGHARVTAGGVGQLLSRATALLPELSAWEVVEAWSGLRPLAGRGEPFVFADSRPGLVHGLGLHRHGILLAPILGAQLSRLVSEQIGQAGRVAGRADVAAGLTATEEKRGT